MSAQTPVDVWGCIPSLEQGVAYTFLPLEPLPFGAALADLVDGLFIAATPAYWERRLAAWRGNWGVGEVSIEVDEVPLRFYVDTLGWSLAVGDCAADGGCAVGDSGCPVVLGRGSPAH